MSKATVSKVDRVFHAAQDRLAQVGESIVDAGSRAKRAVRRGGRSIAREVEAQHQNAVDTIQARPITSVLVGFGIGIAFGVIPFFLLRRARSGFFSN